MLETNLIQNIPVVYMWDTCTEYKNPEGTEKCSEFAVAKIPNATTYQVDDKGTTRTMDRFLCLKHWTEKHSKP